MLDVALAVLMFTGIVLLLVGVLLGARRKLVASGEVSIVINDDESMTLKTPAGGTLLGALADNKIFIPSACGGKGACGVCEVVVKEGGGDLLPTETGFISPGEARRGCLTPHPAALTSQDVRRRSSLLSTIIHRHRRGGKREWRATCGSTRDVCTPPGERAGTMAVNREGRPPSGVAQPPNAGIKPRREAASA